MDGENASPAMMSGKRESNAAAEASQVSDRDRTAASSLKADKSEVPANASQWSSEAVCEPHASSDAAKLQTQYRQRNALEHLEEKERADSTRTTFEQQGIFAERSRPPGREGRR